MFPSVRLPLCRVGEGDRCDRLLGVDDGAGIARQIDLKGSVHHFRRIVGDGVLDDGDVVSKFRGVSHGCFDAGVGHQSDHDDTLDAMALQLEIEISGGKAARAPMLGCDDLAVASVAPVVGAAIYVAMMLFPVERSARRLGRRVRQN